MMSAAQSKAIHLSHHFVQAPLCLFLGSFTRFAAWWGQQRSLSLAWLLELGQNVTWKSGKAGLGGELPAGTGILRHVL